MVGNEQIRELYVWRAEENESLATVTQNEIGTTDNYSGNSSCFGSGRKKLRIKLAA